LSKEKKILKFFDFLVWSHKMQQRIFFSLPWPFWKVCSKGEMK
jgi:hypothetical protein